MYFASRSVWVAAAGHFARNLANSLALLDIPGVSPISLRTLLSERSKTVYYALLVHRGCADQSRVVQDHVVGCGAIVASSQNSNPMPENTTASRFENVNTFMTCSSANGRTGPSASAVPVNTVYAASTSESDTNPVEF